MLASSSPSGSRPVGPAAIAARVTAGFARRRRGTCSMSSSTRSLAFPSARTATERACAEAPSYSAARRLLSRGSNTLDPPATIGPQDAQNAMAAEPRWQKQLRGFAGRAMRCAGWKGRSEGAQHDFAASVKAHGANPAAAGAGGDQPRANADPFPSEAVRHPHDSREMRGLLPKAAA